MKIEILLTETEIAQEFSESMEARDIPEKFFYWFPLSAQAWLALARDPAYDDLRKCWERIAEKIHGFVKHFDGAVPTISFGAGDGLTDRLLLAALQKAGREVRYFPVDASQALLEAACGAAEDQEIETLGIKADISSPVHLVLASDASESPKLFLVAGNTIGSFDPLDQIRHIGGAMHEGDRLIVDAELYEDNALERTGSKAMQHFAFAPLASIGITHEDGEVGFESKRDERHEGLYQLARRFRADRDLRATVSGKEIVMERGERLSMNFQYLYTRQSFRWLLEDHARLEVLDEIVSPDGRFVVAVCSR
jgi:Histidine-specific methyltransferase, SAM-dependent